MNFKKDQYEDDDGRVIVNMDVDGMPWHDRSPLRNRDEEERPGKKKELPAHFSHYNTGPKLTDSQARQYTWYAMLTGFGFSMVFVITWVLFILFCTEIWFK